MLIYHATLFFCDPVSGKAEEYPGYLRFENGVITNLGAGMPAAIDDDALDAGGGYLIPGLIDAHSHLGMVTDSVGFEGDDVNEDSDPITPQMRAIDAVFPQDRGFREAREAGITTVVTGPGSANAIGGTLAAIKTDGICVDDMVVNPEIAMKFALGENPKSTYHQKSGGPETRMASAALIREALQKARRYQSDLKEHEEDPENISAPEYDAKCEALLPVLNCKMQAHFHAHRADDICTALRISKEFRLDVRLIHCTEGHLIPEVLKREGASAFLGPFFLTRSKPELARETEVSPRLLDEAGVDFALITDHPEFPEEHFLLSACLAVKNGLSREKALRAVTSAPARLLGLEKRIGTFAKGLDADLVLFDRDPFSFYAAVKHVFIGGKQVK